MLWHGKSFYQRRSSKAFGNGDCLADLEWRSEERQSKLRHYGLRQISAPAARLIRYFTTVGTIRMAPTSSAFHLLREIEQPAPAQ